MSQLVPDDVIMTSRDILWKTLFPKFNEYESWSVGTKSKENSNELVPAGTWWRHVKFLKNTPPKMQWT